jgi:hypothetical protein
MENGPFIDDFPINTSIYKGFSMAMLNNQMVCRFGDESNMPLEPKKTMTLSLFELRLWPVPMMTVMYIML